jgi:Tol biopolymer transport system component
MLAAGTTVGAYEIRDSLGAGGMGEVYRARDTRLDRAVAIKVLPELFAADPDRLARFEREAKSVAQLSHPNILNIFDFGVDGPTTYAVMELLDGEPLSERLARGPIPPRKAIEYGIQIASGLAAAHGRGIVHRDIKPANLFITHDDRVKILDFGLAKPIEFAASDVTAAGTTAAGLVMGTVGYMAPEQVRAQATDHRSDIFALGAVLYEMIAGHRAFRGESPADTISAILNSDPPDLEPSASAAPPALERIVRRCLEKKPELRFQSAQDLAFALETLSSRSSGATAATVPASRARGVAAALPWIVAVLAVAAAAAAWVWRTESARPPMGAGEVRLALLPPVGLEFAQDASDFNPEYAVSPDGRQVLFVAVDASGVSSLWIRDLGSVTPWQIAGATGASRAFWSADGRQVVYITEAGLVRISVGGGTPQGISTGRVMPALNSDVAWGAAGTILFEADAPDGGVVVKRLFAVPEAGGTAVPVARDPSQPTEQAQRYPVFLADGRRFLYLSWTPDPANRAIFLASLDGGPGTRLVGTGFAAGFVAPDILLYIKESALVAQRFSASNGTLAGEPRTVVSGLALEAIPGGASFAPSPSGVIAYRSRSRNLASELRWISRQGRVEPASLTASDITVALSPDNRLAAFTRVMTSSSRDDRFPSNVWLFDLIRGVSSRLTVDPNATDENPLWSPDGSEIAYATHSGGALAEVYVQSAMREGKPRRLAAGPENFHPVHWGRHGLLLQAYATGGGSDDIDLWTLSTESGARPRPFIREPGNQSQGQFSPDGRWVAYTSNESGRPQVYARAFPAGTPRLQISSDGGAQPRWRPDGRELFFVSPAGTVMAVALAGDDALTPGPPVALFSEPSLKTNNNVFFYGGGAAYDVSRDGQRFLVSRLTAQPSAGPIQVVINAIGSLR